MQPAAQLQRPRGRPPVGQLRIQPGGEGAATELAQGLQQCALPRRTRGGMLLQRLVSGNGELQPLLHRHRRCARAQGRRQRRQDDLAQRVVVVVGGPAQQRQQVAVDQGRGIQQLTHRLQARRIDIRVVGMANHDANRKAPANGHPHACASRQRAGLAAGRRQVVQRRAQLAIDRDFDETQRHSGDGICLTMFN